MLEQLNRHRAMYNEVTLRDIKSKRSPIPTMCEYREWVHESHKWRKPFKKPSKKINILSMVEKDNAKRS